jgi:hypothetical protein
MNIKESLNEETIQKLSEIMSLSKKTVLFRESKLLPRIRGLEDTNNPRILKYLLLFSLDKSDEVGRGAEKIIRQLMEGITYKEIRFIDSIFRTSYYYYSLDSQFIKIDIANIKKRVKRFEDNKFVLCLLSLHENGYIREVALKQLNAKIDQNTLPYILLRTNDWVENVCNIAKGTIENFFKKSENIECILASLELIEDMKRWRRNELTKIFLLVETLLIKPTSQEVMKEVFLKSENRFLKRALFKYLLLSNSCEEDLLIQGIKSKDPIIIGVSIRAIKKSIEIIDKRKCFNALKDSKSTKARVAALEIAEFVLDESKFEDFTLTALCDRALTVRESARDVFSDWEKSDFCRHYHKALSEENSNHLGAILGIGEVGTSKDIEVVNKYLANPNAKIRKATLTTIHKIDGNDSIDLLVDWLCSEDIIDSRHAKKLLIKRVRKMDSRSLYELFELDGFKEFVYIHILELINFVSKWDRLELFLKAIVYSKGLYMDTINCLLRKWESQINKSFVVLEDIQKNSILELLNDAEKYLDDEIIKKIRFTLK